MRIRENLIDSTLILSSKRIRLERLLGGRQLVILDRLDRALKDLTHYVFKFVDEIRYRKVKQYPLSLIPTGKEILYAGSIAGSKRRVLSLIAVTKAYTWPSEIVDSFVDIERKVETMQEVMGRYEEGKTSFFTRE